MSRRPAHTPHAPADGVCECGQPWPHPLPPKRPCICYVPGHIGEPCPLHSRPPTVAPPADDPPPYNDDGTVNRAFLRKYSDVSDRAAAGYALQEARRHYGDPASWGHRTSAPPRWHFYASPLGGALLSGDDALFRSLAALLHMWPGDRLAPALRGFRDDLDRSYIKGPGRAPNARPDAQQPRGRQTL